MHKKLVIFTDLDGTLIDHKTYSYKDAQQSLEKISRSKTSLILVSSKTAAEILEIIKDLHNDGFKINHPFICENGSAIYIPKDYHYANPRMYANDANNENSNKYETHKHLIGGIYEKGQYQIIKISQINYQNLCKTLKEIGKNIKGKIIGFNDLTPQELSDECGLTVEAAKLAKTREFDEPFSIDPNEPELYRQVEKFIRAKGLNYTKGGRYAHIMGKQDKGLAVKLLSKLYKKQFSDIKTIGIGDSRNDLEMLEACDEGYLVANPKKPLDAKIKSSKIHKLKEIGPKGFNKIVLINLNNF